MSAANEWLHADYGADHVAVEMDVADQEAFVGPQVPVFYHAGALGITKPVR